MCSKPAYQSVTSHKRTMECLKLYHDLAILSEKLPAPFLAHFFARFDPAKSKALASSTANFHLRDLESADYRSAYHMLCDWFYGWNVTDGSDSAGGGGGAGGAGGDTYGGTGAGGAGEHFTMRRVPREINVDEEGERVECDRICKTYETLFGLSRRVLKRYYLDIEELVPKIGERSGGIGPDGRDANRDEGEGMDDVDKVWQYKRQESMDGEGGKGGDGDGFSRGGSTDSLDNEMEALLNASRMQGVVVKKKTASQRALNSRRPSAFEPSYMGPSRRTSEAFDFALSEELPGAAVNRRASVVLTAGVDAPFGVDRRISIAAPDPELADVTEEQADGAAAGAPAVRQGVLYEAPGEEDLRRGIQSDINHIYVQLDRSTDYTLVCLSTAFCVLTFSQVLGNQELFLKYSVQAQELSMDFVSNTLKAVWDLLNKELGVDVALQDLRHPELLKIQLEKVIELRKTAAGKLPRYRWRKLYRKFQLLHELFTSVDAHLFPNFLVAHKEGVKTAKYSTFDSSLWLTGGYDCVIRIHDIRAPPSLQYVTPATPGTAGLTAGGLAGGDGGTSGAGGASEVPDRPTLAVGPAGGNTGHTCLAQYVGHKSIITDVHFTRDDTYIVSSSFDRTVKVWNAQSASCERTLRGHVDAVTTCDVSADGRYIASGSTDCTIRLWDFNNGECIAVIKKHTRWVKVVRFSHDSRFLMTAGLDKRIYVWDLKILINSRAISHTRCIEAHSDYILDMATSRPSLLATTSRDSTVRIFDYVSGQEIAAFDLQPSWACTICFSDDGQYIATGSFDNNVVLFRVKDATRVRQIRVLNLGILCVRFPKDLSYISVGSTEGFLQQIPL
ncbi:WD40-repeat-containing domain protein [Geranomyces variabilis]|nr:WD40-repeat-containing domain protein [Geranomyces variabilis]